MKSRYVGFILFFVFLLEGTLVYWLIPSDWQQDLSLAPRFMLVMLMIYTMNRNRHIGLAYALVFGLIHDIVYASPMIGAHSLSMAIVVYMTGFTGHRLKLNMAKSFLIIAVALLSYDMIVFSLYRLFRVTVMTYNTMFAEQLAPTLLFNLLFAIIIYVPMRKLLEKGIKVREEEA